MVSWEKGVEIHARPGQTKAKDFSLDVALPDLLLNCGPETDTSVNGRHGLSIGTDSLIFPSAVDLRSIAFSPTVRHPALFSYSKYSERGENSLEEPRFEEERWLVRGTEGDGLRGTHQ